ncbi:MAG: chromosome segregation protein SMC, partial [Candidatus Omnitrophica bacterium]|nr:chromosome segregation protein SMC [Candidatus Omnitrophota bacterium]
MRLKKLEIFGFKSFADKTEIIFDHGVTCIVGPNGCGKSNISDSIRWVLGERSAKLLRGSKMEDVIFNGTDFRKPLAMAEVSLTIDNSNRGLPIDFQEVTLTRRLYRSGESEYLINKTVCRLKDIQDLILDTGIGSNSYSMIEQGRIDYILNAGPDERRFLIEEAAGISKFKVKKEEAIRKLERTEENLLRLKDIVHEVERNIQYAERQARRAERYKEQLEKLKDLEIRKAFYELSALGSQKKEQEEKLIGLKQKIQELDQSLADVQSQYHDLNNQMHNISNRQATEDARRYEIRSQIEQNKQLLRFNQEKRRSLDVRQGEIAQEKSALEEQLQKNFQEMAEKEQELAGLEQEKRALHGFLNSAEEKLRKIESELAAKRSELEQTKSEAFSAAASTSSLRNEFHRISAFLETTAEHQKKQEAGAVRFQQEIENWAVKEKTYAEEVAAFGEKSLKLQQEKSNCENQIKQANESLESLRLESTKWDRLLHEKEARLKMLAEIDRASGTNIDHLLSQSPTLQKDLVRSLRDLFTVESGYELALEACLGTYVHSLVVDDIATAQNLFSLLHDQSPSPVGVLIREKGSELQNAVPPIHPKIKKSLNDVVRIKPEFNSVVASFLNHVFLLDPINAADLAELLPMADKDIFVSSDGWVLGPHQRIFYRPGNNSAETNTFKRGAEIKSLQTELEEAKRGKLEFESRIESLRQNLNRFQGRLPKLEEELMDSAIQKESFESLRSG